MHKNAKNKIEQNKNQVNYLLIHVLKSVFKNHICVARPIQSSQTTTTKITPTKNFNTQLTFAMNSNGRSLKTVCTELLIKSLHTFIRSKSQSEIQSNFFFVYSGRLVQCCFKNLRELY